LIEKMSKILINVPEIVETPRLILQMPKAGFGAKVYEAMIDGYEDGEKWLNWNKEKPSVEIIEENCRKHHAEFILRESIRYIIIDKKTDNVVGSCSLPSLLAHWQIPQFGIGYFTRKSQRGNGFATEAAGVAK